MPAKRFSPGANSAARGRGHPSCKSDGQAPADSYELRSRDGGREVPMTSLESYLRGPYKDDGVFLNRLLTTINEVIPIFHKQSISDLPLSKGGSAHVTSWPYAVSFQDGELVPRGESFSASTHCMILFALDALTPRGKDKHSILLGEGFRPSNLSGEAVKQKELQDVIVAAKNALVTAVHSKAPREDLVESGTYGKNDPFTLTWLTELAFRWTEDFDFQEDFDECKQKICRAVDKALGRATILETGGAFSEVTSSFLKVRRLHLARSAKRL